MTSNGRAEDFFVSYDAPIWTRGLKNVPTHKVQFVQENTPIQKWHLPGIPEDMELFIKREDLTGSVLSGNKVRCLEFVLGDAIKQGCTSIVTCGPALSNSMRALSVMAASLGLTAHLLVKNDKDPDTIPCVANFLILRMMGAKLYLIPEALNYAEDCERIRKLTDKIRTETGEKVYPIINGENPWMFGYVDVFHEMTNQGLDSFTDIVSGSVTAGTSAGLVIANHLTGSKIKIHGMVAGETSSYQHDAINAMLRYVGLQDSNNVGLRSQDAFNTIDGPIGDGYGLSTREELEFIKNVAKETGILLTPVYAGKAAYHLVKKLNTNPEMFKGKKILFIHTGGMTELFDGRMENMFDSSDVKIWRDLADVPSTSSKDKRNGYATKFIL